MTNAEDVAVSTFGQRLEYARDRQRPLGTWQTDEELGKIVGLSSGSLSEYKSREIAPPADKTLAIAKAIGVDPGWLAFGRETTATPPEGFDVWLANQRNRKAVIKRAPLSKFKRADVGTEKKRGHG